MALADKSLGIALTLCSPLPEDRNRLLTSYTRYGQDIIAILIPNSFIHSWLFCFVRKAHKVLVSNLYVLMFMFCICIYVKSQVA